MYVLQVSRLILLAGASASARTDQLCAAPPLCLSAQEGHAEMVSLLLEFGADVNGAGDDGVPALSYAAQRGHISVIRQLLAKRAKVRRTSLV